MAKDTESKWDAVRTAQMLDMTEQYLRKLARNGIIPGPDDNGVWPAAKCCIFYIRFLREGKSSAVKEDRNRKMKAEAAIVEMEAAKLAHTLCPRSEYLNNYADAIAQGVSRISRLPGLTKRQKEDVFTALRSVKLRELKFADEEDDELEG